MTTHWEALEVKICPIRGESLYRSFAESYRQSYCLGIRCMMWRWVKNKQRYDDHDEGYCGLAGPPPPFLHEQCGEKKLSIHQF